MELTTIAMQALEHTYVQAGATLLSEQVSDMNLPVKSPLFSVWMCMYLHE